MFAFVKSYTNGRATKTVILLGCAALAAMMIGCGGDDGATPTVARATAAPTSTAAGNPLLTAVADTPAVVSPTEPGAPSVETPARSPLALPSSLTGDAGTSVATGSVPPDCESVIPTREIADLVRSSLTVLPGAPARSGLATQIVCRYLLTADASADKSVIVVVAGYADAGTAAAQDASGRRTIEGQGGSFTPVTGVGEEAYSFVFPSLAGISARLGSHTVSLGVGKALTPPSQDAVESAARRILANAAQ